ncbi:MAG: hypothetical protein ABI333_06825 [bacterium]
MKKLLTILLVATFGLGALAAGGCNDPCTKAADKMIECLSKDDQKLAEKLKKDRDKGIEECKKNEDSKQRAKKCAGIDDCKKFVECMSQK